MTERQFRELEVQIARYRFLEREVTDPLAACLLHGIVAELEADLRTSGWCECADSPVAAIDAPRPNIC